MQSAILSRFRRLADWLFIVVYLGVLLGFLGLYAWGDAYSHPVAYFWTWDMFPGYECFSFRRTAVGKTASGRYVELLPGPMQKFHWGVRRDLTRVELLRTRAALRPAVTDVLRRTAAAYADDPVRHVYLLEQYWPARFNYTDRAYERLYGEPKPRRRYWKVFEEYDVPASTPDAPAGEAP
jgi:hypothetical protein